MSVKDEILQYLSKYNKTNICFPKLFFCKGNLSEKENDQQLVDSIFGNCGKKEGIEVWVINKENKNPTYLKKNPESIESLCNKNNYIFLKTSRKINHKGALILKPKFYHEIFYWIGNISNVKNNFSVCYYTSLLSYKMNPKETFREEFQNETQTFQNIFKNKN